jgi:hypothetical protein
MGRSVRTAAKAIAIAAGIGFFGLFAPAACTSRTLPLPPPEVKSVTTPDSDGLVTVSGYALEGASVGVMNESTQEGVITASEESDCDNTCAWEARIHAQVGDRLRVWQFFETDGAKDVVVPKK